jgi:MFS family permease
LIAAFKAPYAIAVDAASFAGSALFMTAIKRVEELPAELGASRRRMRAEIGDGLRYVLRHPLMRPLMLFVATSNFFSTMIGSILLVFAVRVLQLSAATIGVIFSLASLGSLAGALTATKIAGKLGIGRTLIGLAALSGLTFVLVPLAAASYAIVFLVTAYLVYGFAGLALNINGISLLQAITPDRLLGRMNASRRFVVWGVIPLGGLTGGALGSHLGLRETMWIGAIGTSLAFLPLLLSPLRQIRDIADAEALVREINAEFADTVGR